MAERRNNLSSRFIIAARAVLPGGESAFGAGCAFCGVLNKLMTERGNRFLFCSGRAACADLSFRESGFCAGWGNCLFGSVVMAECRNACGSGSIAATGAVFALC